MLVIAGIAGASAMILPGISGGYLLLILGQYVPILSAVDTLKTGLKGFDTAVISHVFVTVLLPVGIGILVGVIGVSNLLRFLLKRYHRATLGVLLGILLGAVVGLWPFQHAVKPEMGDIIKGETVTTENIHTFEREDYPTDYFTPTFAQVAGSIGLIGAGFLITYYISRFGERGHTQGNHDTA
jgi:putative membrane protein